MTDIPKGEGKLIYVAGKYSSNKAWEVSENIWHACRVAVRLWELNYVVFCPHMNTAHFEIYSALPKGVYLKGDLKFLEICQSIFMLKGYKESVGAMVELEVAKELGLTIYYEDGDGVR